MARQGLLPIIDFSDAVEALAAGNAEDRGAVFTRREVVEFILDLAGYTQDLPLYQFRILEPSFGNGDFLLPVVERLLAAYISHGKPSDAVHCLSSAIRAVEIHPGSIQRTRTRIAEVLESHGITRRGAAEILQSWIIQGAFLFG
ncbi:MAG: modification methylase PaeR7I, partial [Pirellulales bacterium]|nr:modification methylase PaeR7I [Pirellulales bacterium]